MARAQGPVIEDERFSFLVPVNQMDFKGSGSPWEKEVVIFQQVMFVHFLTKSFSFHLVTGPRILHSIGWALLVPFHIGGDWGHGMEGDTI